MRLNRKLFLFSRPKSEGGNGITEKYQLLTVAEESSLDIAGNCPFFASVGLGKTGKSRTRARTGTAERAHQTGETGTARPQIRPQGSYEGDLAERKPASGVPGAALDLIRGPAPGVIQKRGPSPRAAGQLLINTPCSEVTRALLLTSHEEDVYHF